MQDKLVHSAPVRYDATIVSTNGLVPGPHKESDSVLVSGFLICKSGDTEIVEAWSKSCPLLKYPNSSVEIKPLVPFPTKKCTTMDKILNAGKYIFPLSFLM